jgi:hypothetical protein
MAGYNSYEDISGALETSPLNNDYWESKRIHAENIKVPMYLTASYSYVLWRILQQTVD